MKYEIVGEPLPAAICHLESGESIITENGAMSWMSPNMQMETSAGGIGKALKRSLMNESMFQNIYTAQDGPGLFAMASGFPGSLRVVEVTPDRPVVAQKSAFLACEKGVEMSIFFQKKGKAGFFSGEGFIMQKFSGSGLVFLAIDGFAVEYDLKPGESMVVDTGNVAMVDASCTIDAQAVKGLKNMLLGDEGFFNTIVTGPGRLVLQTMPIKDLAQTLKSFLPSGSSGN